MTVVVVVVVAVAVVATAVVAVAVVAVAAVATAVVAMVAATVVVVATAVAAMAVAADKAHCSLHSTGSRCCTDTLQIQLDLDLQSDSKFCTVYQSRTARLECTASIQSSTLGNLGMIHGTRNLPLNTDQTSP